MERDGPPVLLLGGLNLVRALGLAGIPVIVATTDRHEPALSSRYCNGHFILPPLEHPLGMVDALLSAGRELAGVAGRKVPIFYSNDEYLSLIQQHREALAEHFLMLLNDAQTDAQLLDKSRFEGLARERGLTIPRALSWHDLPRVQGPVLAKPRARKLRREMAGLDVLLTKAGKARVFASGREAAANPLLAELHQHFALQEYIPGLDAELVSFHGFSDEAGRLLAWFCGRKIRTYPALTGMSSFVELIHDASLERAGRAVAEAIPLRGVFKIDFKRDARDGRFVVLEVNTRFNLWHYLGAANGLNLAEVAYRYLVDGERPADGRYGERYRWVDFRFDYLAFRELASRGALSWRGWLSSLLAKRKVYQLFSWTDPLPFLRYWSWRISGRLLRMLRSPNARAPTLPAHKG